MTTPTEPVDLSHLSDAEFHTLAPQGYHGVGDCKPQPLLFESPEPEALPIADLFTAQLDELATASTARTSIALSLGHAAGHGQR